ncbi:MAG: PAS domain S-box protein, partial [Planctomycetota bacterium]|nr:PAS domain S-box protein [Planctomycetota bacterium]
RISESRKQAMLNAGLDSIITIDHEGRIVDFNKAAEMKFGWSCDQVMGKIMSSVIIPPAYRDAHERGLRHYLRSGEGPVLGKRIQVEAMRSDGSTLPIEMNICLIEIPNHPPQFTAFLRDLSES